MSSRIRLDSYYAEDSVLDLGAGIRMPPVGFHSSGTRKKSLPDSAGPFDNRKTKKQDRAQARRTTRPPCSTTVLAADIPARELCKALTVRV